MPTKRESLRILLEAGGEVFAPLVFWGALAFFLFRLFQMLWVILLKIF